MPPKPETYIATEIDLDIDARRLHEIVVTGYRQHLSACCFSSGKRAGASASDLALYHGSPAWGPHRKLYILKHAEIWKLDQAITIGVCLRRPDIHPVEVLEIVPHASLWDFYKYISYDWRTRRYRDAQGRPIRYSVTGTSARGDVASADNVS